jgi:Tim44-like domain
MNLLTSPVRCVIRLRDLEKSIASSHRFISSSCLTTSTRTSTRTSTTTTSTTTTTASISYRNYVVTNDWRNKINGRFHLSRHLSLSSSSSTPRNNDDAPNNINLNNNSENEIKQQQEQPPPTSQQQQQQQQHRPSLEETIRQMKGDTNHLNENKNATTSSENKTFHETIQHVSSYWEKIKEEIQVTWNDLITSGERKSINKKIHPVETKEGDTPYTGPVEIMIIDEAEHLTAWQRMQKRLSNAPIIQDILSRTEEVYQKSGAAKMKEKVDIIREDAKEAWETSQNPWVYRISSVYDTLTAPTPESIAVKELRILDPTFTLDDWREDVIAHTLPSIMKWFLEGRINQLKPWLGEGVFKRLAAEMKAREKEGVQIDTHVLGIMNSEIIAVEVCVCFVFSSLIQSSFTSSQIHFLSNFYLRSFEFIRFCLFLKSQLLLLPHTHSHTHTHKQHSQNDTEIA